MTDASFGVVRELYDAINRVDWDRMLELAVPDFEWETDPRVPQAGVYRGEAQLRRFLEQDTAAFESSQMDVEELFESGDQVVAFIRGRRRIRGSTADIEIHIGHLWTIRDGKAVRCQAFAKREEALQAAGIPAQPK